MGGTHQSYPGRRLLWLPICSLVFTVMATGLIYCCLLPVDNAPQRLIVSIDVWGIIVGALTSTFVIVSAGYAYWNSENILKSLKNRMARPEFHNTGHPFGEKVDAVIIPVSNRGTEQPQWIINHLKPRLVALVCSRESCTNGLSLLGRYGATVGFLNVRHDLENQSGHILANPRDPEEVKHLARVFIAELLMRGIARDRIFVDTTGGMVPMSIGLFQGAEEEGVSSIYINGRVDGRIDDPDVEGQGDPIFISDRSPDAYTT